MDTFFHHYVEILSDPAHLAVEVTLMLLVDVLFLGLIWPFIKTYFERRLQHQHLLLDREHGIQHHEDHVHRAPVIPEPECEEPTAVVPAPQAED